MAIENILIMLLIGGIAGWLAGLLMQGGGFGLLGNIVVGILGSIVGTWLFGLFAVSAGGGILGSIVGATIGAMVLLFAVRVLRRNT